ncbi:urease accessory protein UreD, partial [Streptomyces decoyicus]
MSSGAQLAKTGASFALAASTKETCGNPDGVHATARIRATYNGRVTTLPQLRSDGPFPLRRMPTNGKTARVGIIGAMSAPHGGDRLRPRHHRRRPRRTGRHHGRRHTRPPPPAPATYDVLLTAGEHARLRWLPQPLISAAGSNLHQTYTVNLAATSRLLLREEQLLGRTNEKPGHLVSRIRVHHAGRLLLDQHTASGDPAPGWDGPAVLDGHRAIGQLLVVAPELDVRHAPILLREATTDGCAVLAPLADGPALLATAVAPASSALRELLDEALSHA